MMVMVIGSGGYMGRQLMAALSHAGLYALGASSADGTGINPSRGLFPRTFTIPNGTEVVVYVAQSPYNHEAPEMAAHVLNVNMLSAVHAAILARAASVRRFIYVSTGSVYAPTFTQITETAPVRRDNWYALSKLHGEEALKLFRLDMELIVVRPFGVYGPYQSRRLVPNLIDAVRNGWPVTLHPRMGVPEDISGLKISLCYIDDAINILLRLVREGGPSCLNLAGSEVISIRSIAEAAGSALGCAPFFEEASSPRDSDMIADNHNLVRNLGPDFTPFRDGFEKVMHAYQRTYTGGPE